ncbi:MAG: winged helix-turn-helix transcriptional regulator [Bacteroidales bacterium]|nr:winged helix-turn-helix transcriptional regulator [Bacteroidales bacterium]
MESEEVCGITAIDRQKVEHVENNLPESNRIEEMAGFFQAFSDPTRVRIVLSLELEELCVCDIATIAGVSVSAVSHQLRYLRNLNVVKKRKQGKMVYYTLKDEHIKEVIQTVMEHIHEE